MDDIFEIIFDLIIEGSIEISSNKKVSKYIRYPLIALLILVFTVIIFGILLLGIFLFEESKLLGLLFIFLSLFLFIYCIYKFKKLYLEKNER